MKKILSIGALALGVALLSGAPAIADDEGNGEEVTVAQENPNERICRRVHVTGSNIPQRVCLSRAEWSELREDAQEELRDHNRDSGVNTETETGY